MYSVCWNVNDTLNLTILKLSKPHSLCIKVAVLLNLDLKRLPFKVGIAFEEILESTEHTTHFHIKYISP